MRIVALEDEKVPFICRILPYIVALLGAFLTGALVVCFVAETFEANSDNTDIILATGISLVLFMIAVILWVILGRKEDCPPTRCDWFAIGWASMFAGAGVSFFIRDCSESLLYVAIGFLVVGAILAFLWFKNCAPKSKAQVFITYFVISVFTTLAGIFLLAQPMLACVA